MIIFTDLDGTLLDHQTYSFDAAEPALKKIKAHNIPLVLASSKTAAEIAPLQQAIGISTPAIVENGAGIFWPNAKAEPIDAYQKIRDALAALHQDLRSCFTGFADMGIEGIIETTGLSQEAATQAANRQHSEPGLFSGTEEQRQAFLNALSPFGIKATQGGRFFTLSFGASKADQMQTIIQHLKDQNQKLGPSLALGDAPNDIAMLEAADFGVIIRNDAHKDMPELKGETKGTVTRSQQQGPLGWNAAVLAFIAIQAQDLKTKN